MASAAALRFLCAEFDEHFGMASGAAFAREGATGWHKKWSGIWETAIDNKRMKYIIHRLSGEYGANHMLVQVTEIWNVYEQQDC